VACTRERRVAYRILVGKPDRRRQLGKPKHRWGDTIAMDLHEVGLEAWTGLMWLRNATGSWRL